MPDSDNAGTADAGTQAVTEPATDAGTATADTQPDQATQPEQADSQPSDSTHAPPETPAGKQDQRKPDTANPWDSDANPYRKRFNDTLSHAQRLYQEKQERDRQFQETQTKLAEYEQRNKAQAESAKLRRWDEGHPEYEKHRALRDRADFSRKMLANAQTPEDQAAARRLMAGQFSAEELAELEQSEQDRKETLSKLASNPRGFIAMHVQDAVRAAIQEYDAFQGARSSVQGIIQDPNNAKLIESYAPDMARMMDPGVPARDKAFEYAKLKAEVEALKAQASQKAVQVATADARRDALNGRRRRSSMPDDQAGERSEAYERLEKRGIKPGDPRFSGALADELLRK